MSAVPHASPQQRKAIEAPPGPTLVVAGPGAGKTFCLIGRVEHLVSVLGVRPERICVVTFTNKAAQEIADRLDGVLAHRADEVTRGTIHSLCSTILREHGESVGLRPGFGIADDDYQETVLRRLNQWRRARQLINLFSRRRLQNYALTAGDEQLYREYTAQLRRRNMVDFDDLVVLTAELFERHAAVAATVASHWDHVLVDEFQDVNAVQYAVLKRLAQGHRSIFVVGDDEQSIFAFAGADPEVLRRFAREHAIAAPIVLDRNHRSSEQIFGMARRLLGANPSLFDKQLTAPRQSVHVVRAVGFADDDAEAEWLVADLAGDRAEQGLEWGDCAILYRRHEIGDRLEGQLIKSGIPCRLARGRPLADDPVTGYVVRALDVIRSPTDPVAAEGFARRVLPPHLMERVQAEVSADRDRFLSAVRDVAGSMRGDPDAKKLWRFVYQMENLAGLPRTHATLWGLIQDLLSQRVGTYRNALEDAAADLPDPLEVPPAAALAARLTEAAARRARVVVERMGGLEIALRGLLFESGLRLVRDAQEVEQTELDDCLIGPEDSGPDGLALTLFQALQLVTAREGAGGFQRYVAFDLETTDLDVNHCAIVEIAAVRAERGAVTGTFHSLVRPPPGRPVSAGAQKTHGISDAEVAAARTFAEVWPEFLAFVGADPLLAHNAQRFDVPVLRRMAGPLGGADALVFYDTLPLAHAVQGGSATLESLAQRYGVDPGRSHRALDDSRTLVHVYEALEREREVRSRKTALANLLSYLGLALVLDKGRRDSDTVKLLYGIARKHALGRFTDCLEFYEAERERLGPHSPSLEEVIERLGGRAELDRLRLAPDPARRYPAAIARLQALVEQGDGESLEVAIARFLERAALSTAQGAEVGRHAVNLLTLHSTKGLEFSRVWIVGVEDDQLPGFVGKDENPEHALQEARRLLYVGMTRAIDRLVLTRVERRNGKPTGEHRFLDEMGLSLEAAGTAAE